MAGGKRGRLEVLVACVDRHEEPRPERHLRGLRGWPGRIPRGDSLTRRPRCSSALCILVAWRCAYVNTEDGKPVARDLRKIYQAATLLEAEAAP